MEGRKKEKTHMMSFRVPERLHRALRIITAVENKKLGPVVIEAFEEYVERHGKVTP